MKTQGDQKQTTVQNCTPPINRDSVPQNWDAIPLLQQLMVQTTPADEGIRSVQEAPESAKDLRHDQQTPSTSGQDAQSILLHCLEECATLRASSGPVLPELQFDSDAVREYLAYDWFPPIIGLKWTSIW